MILNNDKNWLILRNIPYSSNMKKLQSVIGGLIIVLTMFVIPQVVAAQKGEKYLGINAGYSTLNQSAQAGLSFQYSFSDHFRLSPGIEYIFRHKNSDGLFINIDGQFPILNSSSRFNIYPLAGLTYMSWTTRELHSEVNPTTNRVNRFGFNVGAGLEYRVTGTLKILAELKWLAVKNHNCGCFTVGLGYIF